MAGLNETAQKYVALAVGDKTRTAYDRTFERFRVWCVLNEHDPDRPPAVAVTNWLAVEAEERQWSEETTAKARSALAHYYKTSGLPDPTKGAQTIALLAGIAKTRPKEPPREAYRVEPLIELFLAMPDNKELETSKLRGKLIALAEMQGLRVSDIVGLKETDLKEEGPHSLRLRILPKETRKKAFKHVTTWAMDDPKLCWHCAVREYLTRRSANHGGFVFAHPKFPRALTADTLRNACTVVMRAAELPANATPHTLRRAAATKWRDAYFQAVNACRKQFRWSAGSQVPELHYLRDTPALRAFMIDSLLGKAQEDPPAATFQQ